jgi:tetratricopeptide (TPR) repeat protein
MGTIRGGGPAWCALATLIMLACVPLHAQTEHSPDALHALLRTAEAQHLGGSLREAQATLARAQALAEQRSDTSALARVAIARTEAWVSQTTLNNTGYAEADSGAAGALRLARRTGDRRLVADAEDLAGRTLYTRAINLGQGNYEGPLRHFRRALKLRKAAGDSAGIIESLFRVGLIHERKGESEQAVATYEKGMRLAGEGYPLERSNLARHLAYQRKGQGDIEGAIELFELSLALREEAGAALTRPSALTSLADAHREQGDHRLALEYGRRGLEEAEKLGASRFVVGALISLGQTYGALGDRSQALERLGHAESLAGRIGYVSGSTRARAERERLGQ